MIGTELQGRYRVESEIGRGATGVVYAARDLVLDREVAVKLLQAGAWGAEGRSRLLREARAAARLNHPHIAAVYDAGETPAARVTAEDTAAPNDGARPNTVPYIVMELVRGASLRDLIARGPLPLHTVTALGSQLCDALDHAHIHGVIHRDLKPENILLLPAGPNAERHGAEGAPTYMAKLMDFGLALARGADRLTMEGSVVGTAYYLAPEQALGADVDGRADLYALGAVLYEAATGRVPFQGDDLLTVISQHLHMPPPPPHAYRPDIPASLERVILTLLAKEPAERFRSAAAAAEALAAPLPDAPTSRMTMRTADPRIDLLERLGRGVLVGRGPELRRLQDLWALARAGRAQLALISGEPGVGKTRLAQAAIVHARLSGATVLSGSLFENETGTPYLHLREALGSWVHRLTDDELRARLGPSASELVTLVPEIGDRLGPLLPKAALSPQEERVRLFDTVARLLETLSKPAGLVLFVDDLQWADQGSLAFLQYLLHYLRDAPLLVLGTYREAELDRNHPLAAALVEWNRERLVTRVPLNRLTLGETQAMLAALLDHATISGEFAAAIFEETEGNPFFVEEVLKSLIEQGQVYRGDAGWQRQEIGELSIPQSVREAIGRRLGRLSQDCAEALHIAAVLGKNFRFGELASVSARDEDQLLDGLDEAAAAQLVRPGREDAYEFTHDNIREVLYDELNVIRRRRLHQRAGEALERQPRPNVQMLANHFLRSGDLQRGLRYGLAAGLNAEQLAALDEALDYYEQARECAEALADQQALMDVHWGLSRVYSQRGPKSKTVEHAEAALRLAQEVAPARSAGLKAYLGTAYISHGDAEGRGLVEEAIAELDPETEASDLAMAMASLGRFHHYRGQHRHALVYLEKAHEVAESLDQPEVLATVCGYLSGVYQHLAEMEESRRWARYNMALGERHNYPVAVAIGHEFFAEDAFQQGRWEEAAVHAENDLEIGRQIGSPVRQAWAQFCLMWSFFGLGELARAAEAGYAAIGLAELSGEARLRVQVEAVLAIVELERGDLADARRLAEGALRVAGQMGQAYLEVEAWRSLAEVRLYCGRASAVGRRGSRGRAAGVRRPACRLGRERQRARAEQPGPHRYRGRARSPAVR